MNKHTALIQQAVESLPPAPTFWERKQLVIVSGTDRLFLRTEQIQLYQALHKAGELPTVAAGYEFHHTGAGWYLAAVHWAEVGYQRHSLKCSPQFYQEIRGGSKPYELRFNDRGYNEGDTLELWEYNPARSPIDGSQYNGYTGQHLEARVTHLLQGYPGLQPGYVVMGLELL